LLDETVSKKEPKMSEKMCAALRK